MRAMNDAMRAILHGVSEASTLTPGLAELLEMGFTCKDGYVLWKSFFPENALLNKEFIKKHYMDATGYESSVNKIHIEDYCEGEVLQNMLTFLNHFERKWRAIFEKNCTVIVGIDDDSEFGLSCNLRFHVKREGEAWIDAKELNEFSGAVLISEVNI